MQRLALTLLLAACASCAGVRATFRHLSNEEWVGQPAPALTSASWLPEQDPSGQDQPAPPDTERRWLLYVFYLPY